MPSLLATCIRSASKYLSSVLQMKMTLSYGIRFQLPNHEPLWYYHFRDRVCNTLIFPISMCYILFVSKMNISHYWSVVLLYKVDWLRWRHSPWIWYWCFLIKICSFHKWEDGIVHFLALWTLYGLQQEYWGLSMCIIWGQWRCPVHATLLTILLSIHKPGTTTKKISPFSHGCVGSPRLAGGQQQNCIFTPESRAHCEDMIKHLWGVKMWCFYRGKL